MSRYNPHHDQVDLIYEAAARWRKRCLESSGSALADDRDLWTLDLLNGLHEVLVPVKSDSDKGKKFYGALKSQLASAPSACRQLAAEMLWLVFLFETANKIGPNKKRANVCDVWAWSGETLPKDHPLLSQDIFGGIGSGSPALQFHMHRELIFLVEIMRNFRECSRSRQAEIVGDPWEFDGWLDSFQTSEGRLLPNILPHLLYPDHFERISSRREKLEKLERYGRWSKSDVSNWNQVTIDQELLSLRGRLKRQFGKKIDFYDDKLEPEKEPAERTVESVVKSDDIAAISTLMSAKAGQIAAQIIHARAMQTLDSGTIEQFGRDFIRENEVISHLVVPFLRALGWFDEQIAVHWRNIDVCLFSGVVRSFAACDYLIEVKRRFHDFDRVSPGAFEQAHGYASRFRETCDFVVVTNGIRYSMYENTQQVDVKCQPDLTMNLMKLDLDKLQQGPTQLEEPEQSALRLIQRMSPPL